VGIIASAALVAITSVLHVVARDLAVSAESLHAADEIQQQLLAYRDSTGPIARGTTTAYLKRSVEDAARFIQSDREKAVVDDLAGAVNSYLEPGAGEAEFAHALSAAHQLSLINVEQAREARQRAALWDRLSNVAGTAAAITLLAGVAGFLVWLRRGPFLHVADLSDAMDRFSSGDMDARANEAGSTELVGMARTFNATASALVRARQRQADYISTVIHDIRTPLTAIHLAVSYFDPKRPLPSEPRVRDLIQLIERQLTRLNGLVGDVLNATWMEAGGELTLLRSEFDLRTVASESVQVFRALAPQHVIEETTPPAPIVLQGDRVRIEQVINNLLSNAVKYSPLGSRVRVAVARTRDDATVTVSDEGSGIAPEDRDRIFEPFQRRDATHGEASGTALGLWVSKRVIEAHGGRIELESRVGHGSMFRVVLPLDPPRLGR